MAPFGGHAFDPYMAPILPAQLPLKVRYHALTGFPVSAFM